MTNLIENDFEDGLASWLILAGDPAFAPSVTNAFSHHGLFSLNLPTDGLYRLFMQDYNEIYAQCHIRFSSFGAGVGHGDFMGFIGNWGGEWELIGCLEHDGAGHHHFSIGTFTGGPPVYDSDAIDLSLNTWYDFQMAWSKANNWTKMWVNDDLKVTRNVNLSAQQGVDFFQLGWRYTNGTSYTGYQDCIKVATAKIDAEIVNKPIVYDTIVVKEATALPSTSLGVTGNYGCRVRTVRHATPISPWTAK